MTGRALICPRCGEAIAPTFARPLTSKQVAEAIGLTVNTFYRRKTHLLEKEGMPPPLPGSGQPKWDPAAIRLWLHERGGAAELERARRERDQAIDLEAAEARLLERAAAFGS